MKYLYTLFFVFACLINAAEHKVVFDCSSSDAQFIASRIALIDTTKAMMQKDSEYLKVAITLHGGCVAMVSKAYEDITADEDMKYIQKAQKDLIQLSKQEDVEIVACAMSLENNAIEKSEVLPFIKISKNSFIDTIKYQNDGYALMTFK